MNWHWEEVDETRSGSSGDISKLFKNETIKHPGILAEGSPPADATIMAREVVQNAWDAARDLRHQLGATAPDFEIDFSFARVHGERARELADAVCFEQLARRAEPLNWKDVGLPPSACLRERQPSELSVLRIVESGSSGMYGAWKGAKSKMYLAMVSLGYTVKLEGSGGSYGYGKAGLIRGSHLRTVLAYTCFRECPDDPNVTRRLLGMAYWGPHDVDERSYTGFARLGDQDNGSVKPFENDEADALARELGITVRDPSVPEQLGTTFLLIDPTVQPDDLLRAIERNWWPAIEADKTFDVTVTDYEGLQRHPRPRSRPELAAFVRGFELARVPQDNVVVTERRVPFNAVRLSTGEKKLGTLGLVGHPDGWSYPPAGDAIDHRSLVALVRSPHMVVEYYDSGKVRPYVRGTFLADGDVDDMLRQTEPRGHDAWQTAPGDDSTHADAPKVARTILQRVKMHVGNFRRDLKPNLPDKRDIRLPELEKLFQQIIDGEGQRSAPPPPAQPRPVIIQLLEQQPDVDAADASRIRMRARAAVALSDHHIDGDLAEAQVSIRYKFLEDNRAGQDCPLTFELPDGFTMASDHVATGVLGREAVEFGVLSDAYDPDWTGRLVVEAELVDVPSVTETAS